MPNPSAMFDVLAVADAITRQESRVQNSDVHLFAYLACLLAVYQGHPASDWGYFFAGTDLGSPFSPDLVDALEMAAMMGLVVIEDGRWIKVMPISKDELELLRSLESCKWRDPFISAAVSTLLNLPAGLVRSAVSEEPNLRPVHRAGSTRRLLEGVGLDLLYEQFTTLARILGKDRDLFVPANVWITYLAQQATKAGIEK